MYKYILEKLGDFDWMALFALLTFFFVFTLSAYLIFIKDKSEVARLSNLPLDDCEDLLPQ